MCALTGFHVAKLEAEFIQIFKDEKLFRKLIKIV